MDPRMAGGASPGPGAGRLGPGTGGLRRRSLSNLLRMGHCAPAVMRTLLDASAAEAPWLVRLVAGLPGGIGNGGGECGGITAPLVVLGLRHGRDPPRDGVPVVVRQGQDLLRRFAACHGTTSCREILGGRRLPLRCVGVVRLAPERCLEILRGGGDEAIPAGRREGYRRLHGHFSEEGFHCAHEVLGQLGSVIPVGQELLDATSAFAGGTAYAGMTCSALAAGVMALGLALGEIEDGRLRVLRMIWTMAVGGDAFADDLNAFNRTMNLGNRLSRWFAAELGSTQCRAVTGCDFATAAGANRYVEGGGVARCRAIARRVAAEVERAIRSAARDASGAAPAR